MTTTFLEKDIKRLLDRLISAYEGDDQLMSELRDCNLAVTRSTDINSISAIFTNFGNKYELDGSTAFLNFIELLNRYGLGKVFKDKSTSSVRYYIEWAEIQYYEGELHLHKLGCFNIVNMAQYYFDKNFKAFLTRSNFSMCSNIGAESQQSPFNEPHIRIEQLTEGKMQLVLELEPDDVITMSFSKLRTISLSELNQMNIAIDEAMLKMNS